MRPKDKRGGGRVHDNVHDDMIMYVIMHDQHPVHSYDQHIIAMINSLS